MCGTCGCGSEENGVTIQNPKDVKTHEHHHHHDGHSHSHEHAYDHHHHDHDHPHSHDHSHDHDHEHSHSHSDNHHHKTVIDLEQDILQHNDLMAARNKGYFEAKNIFALNLVSSPGSGKTSILERTLTDLKNEKSFYI